MPYKDKSKRDAYHLQYRNTHKTEAKLYRQENIEKFRDYEAERHKKRRLTPEYKVAQSNHHLKKYGITLEDKQRMCAEQKGKCFICQIPFESLTEAQVDHNHSTGEVRDLLCSSCNTAFGHLRENPEIIQKMLDYAKRWK